ncbi:MAG: isoprenylcysteine carboxyl methyltransferase [Deltaproteobacteria bacterium]|nr:isoprenylcysteine carboxyl methyltransferase [Deltaproteobacteria bacterium]
MSDALCRALFTGLVLLVAVQRLAELRTSARNERLLRARGAREHAAGQMPVMRAVHTLWLVGMLVEVWALDRVPTPWVAAPALALFCVGQGLRLLAMRSLGERWNVKILTLPGAPPVTGGVFGHVRHPNYLGVVIEIATLPLVGGAVITSIVMSLANAVLLAFRIRAEESALREDNAYDRMADRPMLVPRAARRP